MIATHRYAFFCAVFFRRFREIRPGDRVLSLDLDKIVLSEPFKNILSQPFKTILSETFETELAISASRSLDVNLDSQSDQNRREPPNFPHETLVCDVGSQPALSCICTPIRLELLYEPNV